MENVRYTQGSRDISAESVSILHAVCSFGVPMKVAVRYWDKNEKWQIFKVSTQI